MNNFSFHSLSASNISNFPLKNQYQTYDYESTDSLISVILELVFTSCCAIIPFLFITLFLVMLIVHTKIEATNWKQIANNLNFQYNASGLATLGTIHGMFRTKKIIVEPKEEYVTEERTISKIYITTQLPLPFATPFLISSGSYRPKYNLLTSFNIQEIGTQEFQNHFTLRCNHKAFCTKLLTPEIQQQLLHLSIHEKSKGFFFNQDSITNSQDGTHLVQDKVVSILETQHNFIDLIQTTTPS